MRMTLELNEALRLQNWRVFRSATRDHLIPQTGPGAKLQRIRINEAVPSGGTEFGIALTLEERQAIANQRKLDLALAQAESASKSIGVTKFIHVLARTTIANPSAVDTFDEIIEVATAPFDGFITEFGAVEPFGADLLGMAIRTSGGESMFRSFSNYAAGMAQSVVPPDFLSFAYFISVGSERTLRNLHMPVFAGESIFFVSRVRGGAAAFQQFPFVILGFESFTLAKAGSAAAVSAFGAIASASRLASSEAANQANQLGLAQEKTKQLQIQQSALTERAKLAVARPGPGPGFMVNPFGSLPFSESALQQLASRRAIPPPPPRVPPKPSAPPEGAGKTFVSAWNASAGYIGYLIPNPPIGGRVNVFDNTYTIWDITGKNVGQGPIEPVTSDAQIPPGARVSPVKGGSLSPALRL